MIEQNASIIEVHCSVYYGNRFQWNDQIFVIKIPLFELNYIDITIVSRRAKTGIEAFYFSFA